MNAQERAERAGKTMFANDASSPHVGMTLDKISPGKAEMSFVVMDYMLNGAKVCHGGYIFMLWHKAVISTLSARQWSEISSPLKQSSSAVVVKPVCTM